MDQSIIVCKTVSCFLVFRFNFVATLLRMSREGNQYPLPTGPEGVTKMATPFQKMATPFQTYEEFVGELQIPPDNLNKFSRECL
jgi:hypothetical protein